MSRWGEGTFECDAGADYLTMILYQIYEAIQQCVDNSTSKGRENEMDTSLCLKAFVMPGVDILMTLTKTYPNTVEHIVAEFPIATWRAWALQTFDKAEADHKDQPLTVSRRKVIVETFAELESLLDEI